MAELEKYRAQAAIEEQNNALAIRFTDVYQKGDIAAIKEICSPDFIEHGMGQTFSLEQVIETLKGNMAVFSDFTIIAEDSIAKRDKVAVRYRVKVTHTGEGLGIPATGKRQNRPVLKYCDSKMERSLKHGPRKMFWVC